MRITGGKLKGISWQVPANLPLRPTTALAMKGLMNILHHRYPPEGLRILDLFAGTGQISFELASRGAAQVIAVEQLFPVCKIIREHARRWKIPVQVIRSDVFNFLDKYMGPPFDLIIADPPYALEETRYLPGIIFQKKLLSKGGWFILEHDIKRDFSNFDFFLELRKYGHVCFSIFENHSHD